MSDVLVNSSHNLYEKMKDMGDGSHARVVYTANVGGSNTARTPMGYAQLSNADLANVCALPSVPANATSADIQNNGSQNARFRDDGQAPSSSAGQRLYAADTRTFRDDLAALRFIRESDGVTLDILYYGGA